tara:strand:- start:2839 stop:3510 length:672 start_codon:yes stop_codon:yes gene_type:complete
MKLILLIASTFYLYAQANSPAETAKQVEEAYRQIGDKLAQEHLLTGPCNNPLDAHKSNVVGAIRNAKKYYSISQNNQPEQERDFQIPHSVEYLLGSTFAYRHIKNEAAMQKSDSLSKLLEGVMMYSKSQNGSGNSAKIEFMTDSNVKLYLFEEAPKLWKEIAAKYEVYIQNGKPIIVVKTGEHTYTYRLETVGRDEMWHLEAEGEAADSRMQSFDDYPDECSY